MTQITRVPIGLQDFLGTQAQGKNPSEFGQVVAPTIGMDRFLGIQRETWQRSGFGSFNTSAFVSITVPEDEVWFIRSLAWRHVQSGASAGDGYTGYCLLSNNSNSNGPLSEHPISRPFPYEVPSGSGQNLYDCEHVPDVIAVPGSQITFYAKALTITAGNFNSDAFVRYLALKV